MIKIWEWEYRECYSIPDTDLCVKKQKRFREKQIFWVDLKIRLDLYLLFTFWVESLNIREYRVFNLLPIDLKKYFPSIVMMCGEDLVMERIKDFDGSCSKTIREFWKIDNMKFWQEIENIARILLEKNMLFFDIFNSKNIVVKRISENEYVPVIVDFKRLGIGSYSFQFNLVFESERKRKFHKKLQDFKQKYNPNVWEISLEK